MNALPATAFAAAGSWNRSSQADSADGDGTARSRARRQRAFSDRRSARESKSRSIAQDRREAAVGFKTFQVFDAIAAREIEENHRQHHLDVEPALRACHTNLLADRGAKAAGVDQIEIQRQAGQGRQAGA
jgi:hypothetical protein